MRVRVRVRFRVRVDEALGGGIIARRGADEGVVLDGKNIRDWVPGEDDP